MNNGNSGLQDFLKLSYTELEDKNLEAKDQRLKRVPAEKIQEERLKYLTDEKRIKAVTLLFSDLEGRLHMLDYVKKFLLKSWDNLTFDGSASTGPPSTGLQPITSGPARCWCSAKSSIRTAARTRPTSAAY